MAASIMEEYLELKIQHSIQLSDLEAAIEEVRKWYKKQLDKLAKECDDYIVKEGTSGTMDSDLTNRDWESFLAAQSAAREEIDTSITEKMDKIYRDFGLTIA
ncbi:hypothetical protein NX059_012290 [Plenodomus lindquistii]|nr:hypothetical protein NX059_012290 [Plenodomus lindquistii]